MDADHKQELIDEFVEQVKKHYGETLEGHYKIVNKCARRIDKIYEEMNNLGTEGLSALSVLLDHENDLVALMAAAYLIDYNPEKCVAIYKRISKSKEFIGFEAKWGLKNLRETRKDLFEKSK